MVYGREIEAHLRRAWGRGAIGGMHALLTDRYELAMLGAYLREGIAERRGVFELSVRRLPPERRFLLAVGIDRAVRYLQELRFSDVEVEYLRRAPGLSDVMTEAMENYLRGFRFRGDLDAVSEGEVMFEGEPLLRVEASLAEGQLLETFLLGVFNTEVRVASKAARVVLAAEGREVFEFGARRSDPLSAPWAGRAAYVAGCAATSCEQAGMQFGVPVAGTLAHSYVLAHVDDGEEAAFERFAETFSHGTTLLIDTFDTVRGALRAARAGPSVRAVRIDSGDLATGARDVRKILDVAGRHDVKVVLSDDLDEHRIGELVRSGVPCDAFGVGTAIALTPDAPSLGAIYKLVEIEDRRGVRVPVGKRSAGKASTAGARQVWRRCSHTGKLLEDTVGLANCETEPVPEGRAMLVPVLRKGKLVRDPETMAEATARARERATGALKSLPEGLRALDPRTEPSPVRYTSAARSLRGRDG